ncbi:serine hydrolase domain-containing protein [Streptomyces sp. NPDC088387]|uniref:serine hydrolase domain-containing protein n=1 Tax=Streptomyces sp. NPDC088387 TaxID=3365859 RepID=UPI00382964B7
MSKPYTKNTGSRLAVALVGAVLAAVAPAVPASAGPVSALTPVTPSPAGDGGPLSRAELRAEVERTLKDAGYVGISVEVRDGHRRVQARAGEVKLGTGRPVPHGGSLRAVSATKPFVATVILQLVAEGRLSLDDTVEKWLPGVVTGNANDGRRITVRHLLQHTSGIHNYDYTDDTGGDAAAFQRHRFDRVEPEQLVAGAMRSRPDFPPADPNDPEPDWNYSNPNYVLAGMIIEKVTGRPWGTEVHDRIVKPLGLQGTYAPGHDPFLPGPHAHTYHRFPGSEGWTDTTVRDMSWLDAAGSLVTTERDLDRFFTSLMQGRLLAPRELARMRQVVPVGEDFQVAFPGLHYGLGLMRQPLSCGGHRWGHGGDTDGGTVSGTASRTTDRAASSSTRPARTPPTNRCCVPRRPSSASPT